MKAESDRRNRETQARPSFNDASTTQDHPTPIRKAVAALAAATVFALGVGAVVAEARGGEHVPSAPGATPNPTPDGHP